MYSRSSKSILFAATVGIMGIAGASVVLAGSSTLRNSKGKSVSINCNGSGCYVNNKRVGPGGRSNYEKWVWKYGRKGYK